MPLGFYADPCRDDCTHLGVTPDQVGPDFNDPAAWGYCSICAFMVASTLRKPRVLFHHFPLPGNITVGCPGSGKPPGVQPGPEAKRVKLVKLTRSPTQLANLRGKNTQRWVKAKLGATKATKKD